MIETAAKTQSEPIKDNIPIGKKSEVVILENPDPQFGLDKAASDFLVHTDTTTAVKTSVKQTLSVVDPNFFVEERAILELKPVALTNYPPFAETPPLATTAIKTAKPNSLKPTKGRVVHDSDLEPKSLTSYHQFGIETLTPATTAIKTAKAIEASVINDRLESKPLTSAFLQYGLEESRTKLNEGLLEPKAISAGLLFALDDPTEVKTKTVVLNEGLEPVRAGLLFGLDESGLEAGGGTGGKIAAEPKLQLCGGWGGQAGYALDGCVETGLLRPPPQPHSSQLGTVYATKRRRRNGKR